MRSFDFLTEKALRLEDDTVIFQNPTYSAIKRLLTKHVELRGLIANDDQHFVWNSWDALHVDVAEQFGYQTDQYTLDNGNSPLMFVNDLKDIDSDWDKEDFKYNGEFYVGYVPQGYPKKPDLARYFPNR